jgi:hypothetical protein
MRAAKFNLPAAVWFTVLLVAAILYPEISFSTPRLDAVFTSKFFVKAMDYNSTPIRNTADYILNKYPGNSIYQICETFDMVYLRWKYRDHAGKNLPYIRASKSIIFYTGDCKDYASLMVSMFVALGLDGRLVCVPNHVYPEVYLGKNLSPDALDSVVNNINKYYESKNGYRKTMSNIHYHTDADGTIWLNMDWQEYYPGAKFVDYKPETEHLIISSTGKYKWEYLNMTNYLP